MSWICDLEGLASLLFGVLLVFGVGMGAGMLGDWVSKILSVFCVARTHALLRTLLALLIAAVWTMTNWRVGAYAFAGVYLAGWIVRGMRSLLHAVALRPHRPRLVEDAGVSSQAWTDCSCNSQSCSRERPHWADCDFGNRQAIRGTRIPAPKRCVLK